MGTAFYSKHKRGLGCRQLAYTFKAQVDFGMSTVLCVYFLAPELSDFYPSKWP